MLAVLRFLGLLIVIVIGVVAGNLLTEELKARYGEHLPLTKSDEVKVQSSNNGPQVNLTSTIRRAVERELNKREKEAKRKEELAALARERRKNSAEGRKLAKRCEDWTRNHEIRNTETSALAARRHCESYEDYINKS